MRSRSATVVMKGRLGIRPYMDKVLSTSSRAQLQRDIVTFLDASEVRHGVVLIFVERRER